MRPLPLNAHRIDVTFYARPTAIVARELIGKALLHQVGPLWVGGWIVETEAYLDKGDPASHSFRGQTPSNTSMFGDPGTLYVYPIHAKYCMNAVTQNPGEGAAVLIRAIEPVWGIDEMRRRRGFDELRRLTRGPAMLCQALGIDRRDDARCLLSDEGLGVFQAHDSPTRPVASTRRIGISKAKHRKLRFVDADSKFLSRSF